MGLGKTALKNPSDVVVDADGNVYIADKDNHRIIALDRYYKLRFIIETFINSDGVPDELTSPSGVFVTDDRIFVCDTEANRIVTFDLEGNFLRVIAEPESSLF
jgi:DNA-binding beta-propeller fold protein YncE